jgi:hypothetical protein
MVLIESIASVKNNAAFVNINYKSVFNNLEVLRLGAKQGEGK